MPARSIAKLETTTIQANFPWTFVRIYANDSAGLYGTGECFFAPGLEHIIPDLAPLLVGADFTAVEFLVERLRTATSGAGSLAGLVWNAISGIEAALFDLKGKYLGVPVYQLLGGRAIDEVRVYVDCHAGEALECLDTTLRPVVPPWAKKSAGRRGGAVQAEAGAAAERALAMVAEGYDLLKFDLDIPGSTFSSSVGYPLSAKEQNWMVNLASTIRAQVGEDVDLAFDAHWRYRLSDILAVARRLDALHPFWIEDPLPPSDVAGLGRFRAGCSAPLATGENLQLRHAFDALFKAGGCDIATPDLQKAGGLLEAKYIGALAAMYNLPVALHMIASPVGFMTSTHYAIATSNCIACEFHGHDVPFYWELVANGNTHWFGHGRANVTDAPGLGIELDERVARRYLANGSGWFDA